MKRLLTIISLVTVLAGCDSTTKKTNNMEDQKNQTDNSASPVDTTPKVTGIGGIFFFSDNPQETKEWYAKNLGLEINEWGSSFESRNANRPEEINYLQWSPFKKGDEYFSPSKKDFMINYRVQNIEGLVTKLKENGVTILDSIVSYDYGKFVHIMDADGNKIELWEPVDSVLTQMGGKTTK
ncbi:VOC family protein [Proteiniphilum acetatigenes]|uniref:VOC family protein n=1 Tax=Proteiniphilum acetatigenes TaxID=294710 RepID=UPI00039A0594|nr:VOC family protein [Proteiniphilum acetatigenes]SFK32072.1 Catechol 2,3-dioxygenase [Porphyromonadaceae bacterium KH3CP3RA]